MASKLRFHPDVVNDLADAIAWYDERSPGLGDRFRAAVNDRFDAIEANPQRFGFAFEDFRFARVFRFPYVVIFRSEESVTHIDGVFHTATDPAKWRRRMEP